MAIKNTFSAESWEKVYSAFQSINFSAYDYDTIKQSLLDYLKIYHAESFSDFIESSELIALLELFAYTAEQLSYRADMLAHENFITTAQRKQSILKLAKLISYKAFRNYPASGLVKLSSISTTENIIDSLGVNLLGKTINWNDPNNGNWKEQFFLIMNRAFVSSFGQPDKSIQVGDVAMQLYTLNNDANSFQNNVYNFNVDIGGESIQMEVVPADLDSTGVIEKTPDLSNKMSIIYSVDGLGDGSNYTGFLMYVKQGILLKQVLVFNAAIPNRSVDLLPSNVNQIDVWVNKVDSTGVTLQRWENVGSLSDQNVTYNTIKKRQKFEVETLESDRVKIIFGDGDFSEIPVGIFNVWIRQSINRSITIQKNRILDQLMSFSYRTISGNLATCVLTFSLTSALQNSSPSETVEHIRQSAPAVYYSQNRMVNGQDYNTFLLRDPSIIRLKTENRTFAGQPKYIEWNDPSGQYENIKLFGDDLRLEYQFVNNKLLSATSGRPIIDSVLEPLLAKLSIRSLLAFIIQTSPFNGIPYFAKGAILPLRTKFIEDSLNSIWKKDNLGTNIYDSGNPMVSSPGGTRQEKTVIQGALDSHWYGEPFNYVTIDGKIHAYLFPSSVSGEDTNIWQTSIPRTTDGISSIVPGDVGSLYQQVSYFQSFGLKYNPFVKMIGNGTFGYRDSTNAEFLNTFKVNTQLVNQEIWTIVVNADESTVTATSNTRGRLPTLPITLETSTDPAILMSDIFLATPVDFFVRHGSVKFKEGDTFILSIDPTNTATGVNLTPHLVPYYNFGTAETNAGSARYQRKANCTGYWDLADYADVPGGIEPENTAYSGTLPQASWVFWIKSTRDSETDDLVSFEITYRELKTLIESPTTKFWYNEENPVFDSSTGDVVRDKIRITRSNFPTDKTMEYPFDLDVINLVLDQDGEPDFHRLEVVATTKYEKQESSVKIIPAFQLLVNDFITSTDPRRYRYWVISPASPVRPETYQPRYVDYIDFDKLTQAQQNRISTLWPEFELLFTDPVDQVTYARTKSRAPLDFMWQHFSPFTHMIDPSVTNINDAYILTRGYYDNVTSFIEGRLASMPVPPSQLELRIQYATLLQQKMISDTLILHPGKIKLLFGDLAEPELRGKFRILKSPTATLSIENIKKEILTVIRQFFAIENWDFGDTFFVTELITAIHQRLSTEISSVVLVPTYSINSFGSLFTINAGTTEILQSCATLDDIELVDSLTPITLRQS